MDTLLQLGLHDRVMIFLKLSPLTIYLERYEPIYPGIGIWWEKRVIPDILSGIKVIFRHDRNMDVRGLGVFDLKQAKLCHLSLDLAIRGIGLGMVIMREVKREARGNGHKSIWGHGPEWLVGEFSNWSGAKPICDLGTFGRPSIKDVKMEIKL